MSRSPVQYRRIRVSRIVIGLTIALVLILFIRGLGNDAEAEEDLMEQRLSQLYNPEPLVASQAHAHKEKLDRTVKAAAMMEEETIARLKKTKPHPGLYSSSQKCPNYLDYSKQYHEPLSNGPLELPFQRPPEKCRTFSSSAVERVIEDLKERIADPDLARLVENSLPNTLDTTILWHKSKSDENKYAQTFVVTGDIHAEWLRDAARQLSVYQGLAVHDESLKELMRGAINTQASYILVSPYCNAFHPPPGSGIKKGDTAMDKVTPKPQWKYVFECKYEVDSLASFLTLTNEYYQATKDKSIFNQVWVNALRNLMTVLKRESSPTFDEDGDVLPFYYTFQRNTNVGTETLPLAGTGNPVNFGTGLVRSAFRPSDDACIFQFFIPGNAHLSVELIRISQILQENVEELSKEFDTIPKLIEETYEMGQRVKKAIYEHAVIDHPIFGKVFAYEIDGYGGSVFMDDANIPSLLSLPDLGFIDVDDELYQNTRKMILSKKGNPYYLKGQHFEGIGGPHIGIHNAWPMSLLLQIRTSDDDEEIHKNLQIVLKTTGHLGLIHESIQVNYPNGVRYTRPWFAWANSEFGKTILDLAERKPHLIFSEKYKNSPYKLDALGK